MFAAGRDAQMSICPRPRDVDDDPHILDCGVSTVSWSCTHHASPIVRWNIGSQCVRHTVPVAGRKMAKNRLADRLAAFPSRGTGRLSSSNLASAASRSTSSYSSTRLMRSPSNITRLIDCHSAMNPSSDRPQAAQVTTAPRSLIRWTVSIYMLACGVRSQPALRKSPRSPMSIVRELPMVDEFVVRCESRGVLAGSGPHWLELGPTRCVDSDAFTGEVSGIEFRESGVEIVDVEYDRGHAVVGVKSRHAEHLESEIRRGPPAQSWPRVRTRSFAAGRDGGRCDSCGAELSDRPQVLRSRSRPLRIPALTTRRRSSSTDIFGEQSRHRVPVARRKARLDALMHSSRRVLQPRRRPTQLIERASATSRSASSNSLCATDEIAVDRHQLDHSPLCIEALGRGSVDNVDEHRSGIVQPVHNFNACTDVLRAVPPGTDEGGHVAGREADPAPVIEVDPVSGRRR